MRLLVFIQIHSHGEKLAACLESLSKQTLLPDNVVIVDDGTPDESVYNHYYKILDSIELGNLKTEYCFAAPPKEPNLDTVGNAIRFAWLSKSGIATDKGLMYDYLSFIDVDMLLEPEYYEKIINIMDSDPELVCASGAIVVKEEGKECIEEINIGAKIGRKDARGSGKIVKTDFLATISPDCYPSISWDTWINTRAKVAGYKAKQIDNVFMYARPTTRVKGLNPYRNGRLTYHFGYNLLLVIFKAYLLHSARDMLKFWGGYFNARREKWKLPDKKVRKWFGWGFLFHFWK